MTIDDIFKLIVRHTCEVIPELGYQNIQPSDSLKYLGANSVDRAEIIMMTQEALALRIPLVAFSGAKNIGELSELFYAKLS